MQMRVRVALQADSLHGRGSEQVSFRDFVSQASEVLGKFVHLREIPQSRLTIELPEVPPLIEMLSTEVPYFDELGLLHGAHVDEFRSQEKGKLRVSEKLTAIDLFKAQRIFNMVDTMFREKLKSFPDEGQRRALMLRSTVMVIKRANLAKWLKFVLPEDKVEELISLLLLPATDQVKGSPAFIDIQYRPLLPVPQSSGEYIATAPALLGRSNLVRSVLYASKIKAAVKPEDDPMQAAVVSTLRSAGFLVEDSVVFNIQGKRETDIFCYRDGVLFVFECKNAYLPCSPHELRNSYDLIVTSEKQLQIRADWLADHNNQSKLFAKLGWNLQPTTRVYTCAITANRLFSGYRMGAHPVRQAHELMNVVRSGSMRLVGHDQPHRRFWRGDEFHAEDLVDYLEGKSVVQAQLDALVPTYRGYDFRGPVLAFEEYAMSMDDTVRIVDQRFRVIPDEAEAAMESGAASAALGPATEGV